jgi:hypothetical protein
MQQHALVIGQLRRGCGLLRERWRRESQRKSGDER